MDEPSSSVVNRAWRALLSLVLWPAIQYYRGRGREAVLHRLILPLNRLFDSNILVTLPSGARALLSLHEAIGIKFLVGLGFEKAELKYLGKLLQPGDTAFDVGANVGVFTLTFAQRVGASGRVVAFEPLPSNQARLQQNLARNGFQHAQVVAAAVGAEPGRCRLSTGQDGAYAQVIKGSAVAANVQIHEVTQVTLDQTWASLGKPAVRVLKIDVEGAEPEVLKGAGELLRHCQPELMIEANDFPSFVEISRLLEASGYVYAPMPGFQRWNTLWKPTSTRVTP